MKRVVFAIVGLLILPAWSFAAKDFGTITGTVVDSSGRFVSGALVSLAVAGPSVDRMKFTDGRGNFSFENLLPGEYFVQVTMSRFAASGKEKIALESGANAILKFTLMSVAEVLNRATSRDARQTQEIVWTLRSARGEQSVLRFTDSVATQTFRTLAPDYSGYFQLYSKADPGARTGANDAGFAFLDYIGSSGQREAHCLGPVQRVAS